MSAMKAIAAVSAIVLSASITYAQDAVDGFAARSLVGANGLRLPYRIFLPDEGQRRRPLPVVVYLHGSGGMGTDNLRQISGGNTNGTHVWTTPRAQARHPAFVVARSCQTETDGTRPARTGSPRTPAW
jgi:predicted peptidase